MWMKAFLIIIGVIVSIFALNSVEGNTIGSIETAGRYDEYINSEDSGDSYDSDSKITSDNWDCTNDCSGHDAGYEWASDKNITDPDECDGNSDSFIEGCQAYANEYQMENEEEYEEDYDEYEYGY
jgi:hypothetical protein